MKKINSIEIKDYPLITDYGIHWKNIKINYIDGIVGTELMVTMDASSKWLEDTGKNHIKIDHEPVTLHPGEYFNSDLFINNKETQKELILSLSYER